MSLMIYLHLLKKKKLIRNLVPCAALPTVPEKALLQPYRKGYRSKTEIKYFK